MESNPYNLKVLEEKPSGYLTAEEFVDFLKKHKIPVNEWIIYHDLLIQIILR